MKSRILVLLLIVAMLIPAIPSVAAPPSVVGGPSAAAIPEDLVGEATVVAVEDTWVNGWQPSTNYATKHDVYVRSGNMHGALLKFDLSGIPEGATVLDARLTVYPTDLYAITATSKFILTQSHPFALAAYQVYRDWAELDANWLNATAADMWGMPGVGDTASDRNATPDDSVTITDVETKVELDVTPMVSEWVLDGAKNMGVYLGGSATKSMARSFASSNHWNAAIRPNLYVLYTTYPAADKGTTDFQASGDTWISEWAPTANYEGRDRIKVRTGGEFRSLVKFDLNGAAAAALPADAVVVKATLKLYTPGERFLNGIQIKYEGAPKTLAPIAKSKEKAAPNSIGAADAPYCSPDMYEPDNNMEQARWFAVNGLPETHGFVPCEDSDWVKFEAKAGESFMIETLRLGEWYDTILYLYDANGIELAFNDDVYGLESAIAWTAPADGVYYVKVVEYPTDCDPLDVWFDCSSGSYDLRIRSLGLYVYKTLKEWSAGEANWKQASATETWGMEGAFAESDRERPALDMVPLPDMYRPSWVEFDVTKAVRDWTMDMTAAEDNFGFLLEAASDVSREYNFASMEYADASKRPVLEVVYVVKPDDILLNVVATNDFHGALSGSAPSWAKGDRVGTLQWIAGYYNILRNLNPGGVLVLDAGDQMQGTLESNYYFGESTIAGFNAMGVMGATFGNHEFDWGIPKLLERVAQAEYPYVSCNIRLKSDGSRPEWAQPYTYLDVKGVKIGMIGVAEPTTGSITNPDFTGHLDFTNPATEVNAIIDEVIAGGATVVIVNAHLGGYSPDFADVAALANGVDPNKVDLIISGHSHSAIATTINGIPVIQSFSSGTAFGRVDLMIDPWFETVTSSTVQPTQNTYNTFNKLPPVYEGQTVVKDAAVEAVIQPYLDGVNVLKSTVIGETTVPLVRAYRLESNIGDWITDAMRELEPGIDFAMTNSGGIRADVEVGPITFGELFAVAPFGNTFTKVWVTGEQLRATLEDGVSGQHGVVQQSGLRFTFDYDLPARSRIIGDVIDTRTNLPIDPAATYVILVNNFMASGGDHYGTLPLCPQVQTYVVDIDYLAAYLTAHSPIGPVIDGRTTALGTPPP